MHYRYYALSQTGSEIKGSLEGTKEAVEKSLKKEDYYIVSVKPDVLMWVVSSFTRRKIKARDLSAFFEEMANVLHIGITVNEAVFALEDSFTLPELKRALGFIERDLKNGFSLARAFEKTMRFPDLVISMLKVGEKSGNLEKVLMDLSKHYSREADFISGLKNALIYPTIVFSMLAGIMFYVAFKVLPHIEALLPISANSYFAARLLLALSHFLKDYWYAFVLLLITAVIFIRSFLRKDSNKSADYYRLPVIGEITKDIYFTTLFSNMALLQRNGISIIDSLTLIEDTTRYKFLSKKISKIKDLLTSGKTLWEAFENDKFFPNLVCGPVKRGEDAGLLDTCFEKISKYYFDKATYRIRLILSMIQPALLVFCAGILLFLISAFIVPVYSNLSNIAGGNVKL